MQTELGDTLGKLSDKHVLTPGLFAVLFFPPPDLLVSGLRFCSEGGEVATQFFGQQAVFD
jgi:hypothetical protein